MGVSIGIAAQQSALPVKTVRYYSDIGLVKPDARSDAGYRQYSDVEIRKLVFVRRAREFGFSVDECRDLLALYEDRGRSSADVKRIALDKIESIKIKMRELKTLQKELEHLANECRGDSRPDCPIIDSLAKSNA